MYRKTGICLSDGRRHCPGVKTEAPVRRDLFQGVLFSFKIGNEQFRQSFGRTSPARTHRQNCLNPPSERSSRGVFHFVKQCRRIKQRLGGKTSPIQTRSASFFIRIPYSIKKERKKSHTTLRDKTLFRIKNDVIALFAHIQKAARRFVKHIHINAVGRKLPDFPFHFRTAGGDFFGDAGSDSYFTAQFKQTAQAAFAVHGVVSEIKRQNQPEQRR